MDGRRDQAPITLDGRTAYLTGSWRPLGRAAMRPGDLARVRRRIARLRPGGDVGRRAPRAGRLVDAAACATPARRRGWSASCTACGDGLAGPRSQTESARRSDRRTIPDRAEARRGWDGGGVPRLTRPDPAAARDQAAARRARPGPLDGAALPARGRGLRQPGPPAHRGIDRHGVHPRGHSVHRVRVPGGLSAHRGDPPARPTVARAHTGHRATDRLGAAHRARGPARPPRCQG